MDDESIDGSYDSAPGGCDEAGVFSVKFAVERSNSDWWTEGDWDIPEKYNQIDVEGRINSEDEQYENLLSLLRRDDRKWSSIIFRGKQCYDWSLPEFLAIVVACFGKVGYLDFEGHTNNIALVSCLYTGLSMKDGITGIRLLCSDTFTVGQMKMFAKGVSLAQNLEEVSLDWDRDEDDAEDLKHTEALIQALKENKTLKSLELIGWPFPGDTPLRLIQTLQVCPRLSKLYLWITDFSSPLVQDTLRAWLAKEDCMLEDLEVTQIDYFEDSRKCIDLFSLARPNTSIKSLQLGGTDIASLSLPKILSNYKNLVSLDLRMNAITDLEPFHYLLTAEHSTLEKLVLSGNPITVDSIQSFAKRLPRAKALRNLELSILGDDCDASRVLAEATIQNTSLEMFKVISDKYSPYDYVPSDEDDESTPPAEAFLLPTLEPDVVNRLNHTLCLNRAGRRHTGCNPGSLPLNLLPHAISRASKSGYYKVNGEGKEDDWDFYPTSRSGVIDATFWWLRENNTFLSNR